MLRMSGQKIMPGLRNTFGIRNPADGLRLDYKLSVNGHARSKAEIAIGSCGSRDKFRGAVARIRLPGQRQIFRNDGEPCEATARPNAVIYETVLAITPRTEGHKFAGIGIDHVVRPSRRNHHDVTGTGADREAAAWVVGGMFLTI